MTKHESGSLPDTARSIGHEAMDQIVELARECCANERRQIECDSHPEIVATQAQLCLLEEQERVLSETLARVSPIGNSDHSRQRSRYCWTVIVVLSIAAFAFCTLTFEPFHFGWKGYLYCVALAVIAPYCVEKALEHWEGARVLRAVTLAAVTAARSQA